MCLHDCPPPNLDDWLEHNSDFIEGYGHLLVEQINANDDELLFRLKEYFESAHLDARTVFHDFMGKAFILMIMKNKLKLVIPHHYISQL